MACVTLKRPLDHFSESPLLSPGHHQPPTKRRRCVPVRHGSGANRRANVDGVVADDDDGLLASPYSPPRASAAASSSAPSAFTEAALSPSQIASNLRDELKRLKRRRQLVTSSPYDLTQRSPPRPGPSSSPTGGHGRRSPPGSPEPMMDDVTAVRAATGILSGSSPAASSSSSSAAALLSRAAADNKPIFTLKQMTLICERMCKERTDQVREEYDRILNQKLSEQYESFVRFIDQQIQSRFSQAQAPSYLS